MIYFTKKTSFLLNKIGINIKNLDQCGFCVLDDVYPIVGEYSTTVETFPSGSVYLNNPDFIKKYNELFPKKKAYIAEYVKKEKIYAGSREEAILIIENKPDYPGYFLEVSEIRE